MIINIEAQNKYNPGYPLIKRGIYYVSRLISSQYGTVFTDSHYEKIEKVYSIWICPDPPAERRNTIVEYSIGEKNRVGEVSENKENYDLMSVLFICLGGSADKNYEGVIKLLDVLLSTKIKPEEKKRVLKEEFDVSMTKEMESEAINMCNLSQGVEDRARLTDIINLMKNTEMSLEECMDALDISPQTREYFRERVDEMKRLQPV